MRQSEDLGMGKCEDCGSAAPDTAAPDRSGSSSPLDRAAAFCRSKTSSCNLDSSDACDPSAPVAGAGGSGGSGG
ncbi:MAG TPA: hypothetical protein VFS00_21465, partial [Polyangiaceae bacterium]|nr:hypothetical protein [Polyangiaceae bacterium]